MHGWWKERTGGFTAEQMEEHAKAALAAFADLLGIMIASATQIVDGDAVVGYEIKTGALHRMLGMFGGTVHIPLGLPSREAVCAELPPTNASAPASSETDGKHYAARDHMAQGEYYLRHVSAMTAEGLHRKSDIAGELAWRDMEIDRLKAEGESILREALARLERRLPDDGNGDDDAYNAGWNACLEAARSALAGIPLNASGDPTERSG